MDDTYAGFMAAIVLAVVCGFGVAIGASFMRSSIKSECDDFGQTSIAKVQYTCTAKGKGDSDGQ
jgi:hypothetical protein